ncbi:ADP-ribosylglycohydrolase family protein [Weissella koreensis]|uniref:ADP-ribosylglycohydrolase n=1 Tax=Weissella koreensis TaxID=165096 RepID=A0A7H1MN27_9LACO|nr:ADP-ribosylglycohydrolase family protein [Weissella koreensis]AVH75659.1 ADP-ribosylglycohydrolase [Weissella koreensis]QGN20882.1 ADP-ribosylglycohydrolase [Weissella koreensis]QNT64863.1 ADP-ribosylglycohydrolase [Weissella koreensis]
MDLPNNPLINSTLGMLDGDLLTQKHLPLEQRRWSSGSSLALATIDALSISYDINKIMQAFEAWYEHGKYTVDGHIQTAGKTTKKALDDYLIKQDPFSSGGSLEDDNGSGALARMLPMVIYIYSHYGSDFVNNETAMLTLHQVAGLTHNHPRGLMGIGLYAILVGQILDGFDFENALDRAVGISYEYYSEHGLFAGFLKELDNLNTPDFSSQPQSALNGSGYIIDTLENLVWILLNTHSYQEAIQAADQVKGPSKKIVPIVGSVAALMYGRPNDINVMKRFDAAFDVKNMLFKANQSGEFVIKVHA